MSFQGEQDAIRWQLHLKSPAQAVYQQLAADEGRAAFWAESAIEREGAIDFTFPNQARWRGRILEQVPLHRLVLEYYGGSTASFGLAPYPEVETVLGEVLADVRSILSDHFIGMYLYGSLASGDFDRESDVDYVVVTDRELSDETFRALDAMHARIAGLDFWCASQLEGCYIPLESLCRFDPVRALHNHIDRGPGERLQRMQLDDPLLSHAWWGGWMLLRESLRERGVTLAGPVAQTLIGPVSADELRQAAAAVLPGWTKQILDNPAQISGRGYQSYTVLTLCRSLYTLKYGAVVSKRAAAEWARKALEPRWTPLIERAWVGRQNPGLKAEPNDMSGTLDFIRYALERGRRLETVFKGSLS